MSTRTSILYEYLRWGVQPPPVVPWSSTISFGPIFGHASALPASAWPTPSGTRYRRSFPQPWRAPLDPLMKNTVQRASPMRSRTRSGDPGDGLSWFHLSSYSNPKMARQAPSRSPFARRPCELATKRLKKRLHPNRPPCRRSAVLYETPQPLPTIAKQRLEILQTRSVTTADDNLVGSGSPVRRITSRCRLVSGQTARARPRSTSQMWGH